jgi:hypothetical protein
MNIRMQNIQIDLVQMVIDDFTYSWKRQEISKLKKCFSRDYTPPSFHGKYSTPIIEVNMYHFAMKYDICSFVDDSIFFSITDRKYAFDLVDKETQRFLKKINYLQMSDSDIVNFMCKRLDEKAKSMLIKNTPKSPFIPYI